jgi:hypothetical protein
MIGSKVMNKKLLFVCVFLSMLAWRCGLESTDFPPQPYIEFLSTAITIDENLLEQNQINIKLKFYLIDGDGDVGLTQEDIYPPYDANFYPTFYSIVNGALAIDTTLIADTYRIPWVGDLGQDNSLKAEIAIDFEYPFNAQSPFPYDSIIYSFYMVDRALNESNVAWSDTIVIVN